MATFFGQTVSLPVGRWQLSDATDRPLSRGGRREEYGVDTLPLDVKLTHQGHEVTLHFKVRLPPGAGKVPVVIQPSFGPMRPRRPGQNVPILDFSKQFVDRNYAYAEFLVPEIAPTTATRPAMVVSTCPSSPTSTNQHRGN